MASTQQDVANLVVTLQGDVRRFQVSMQQATKDVDKAVRDIGHRIDRLSREQERAWERMGQRSGAAYRTGLRRGGLGGLGVGTVIGTALGNLFDPIQWIRQAARAGDASAQAFLDAWKDVGDDIAISLSNKIIAGLKAAFPEAMKNLPGANETIIRKGEYTGPVPQVSGTGAQRGRQIAQALLNRGYSPEVVRGVLASLRGEQSEFDPTARNPTSGALGFAQWLTPGRRRLLSSIAEATGSPETGMYAQIGTLNRELDTTYAHVDKMLRGAKSAGEAMEIFTRYYEVPATNEADMQKRLAERRRYLGKEIPYQSEEDLRRQLIEESQKPQTPLTTKEGERLATPVTGTEQLDAQVQAYEERNKALDEYLKRQDLSNQLTKAETEANREKIIQLRAEQEARQLNVDLGTKEFDQIKQRVAMTYDLEEAQKKQAETQKNSVAAMEAMQQVGDAVAGAVNTFVQGLINGQSAAEALSNALKQLASQLLSMAINQLFSGLFGGQGGLLGGILGGGGAGAPLGAMGASRISAGGPLGKGGMGTSISIGGSPIHVAGNADAVTVRRMAQMIEINNQRQSAKLNREWGARSARYSSLRGP